MRRLLRVLGAIWGVIGWAILIGAGFQLGHSAGYGQGARDLARLVYELRHTDFETPHPWDKGGI